MYEPKHARLLTSRQFLGRLGRHMLYVLGLMGFSLAAGITGYMYLAGMRFVDAFLNASMLLGGMGPVGDLPDDASKWFAGVYALYAGLVFIASAGILVAPVAHRILHRLHVDDKDEESPGRSRQNTGKR